MLRAPGPIDDVATMNWRRRIALANPTAASAIPCSFWPRHVGSSSRASCSAWPEARDVAVAEDREHAGNERRLDAVDHRALGDEVAHDRLGGGRPVTRLTGHPAAASSGSADRRASLPRVAHPVVGRIVAERHRPLAARPGEHVEVVQRVAGRGDARPVVAAGITNTSPSPTTTLTSTIAVAACTCGAGANPSGGVVGAAGPPDPEVVDLLVVHRALRAVVVAVRRVARPVAVRREQLDAHQLVGAVEHAPAT